MDWTTFCETKNTTSACTAEVGCHWLAPTRAASPSAPSASTTATPATRAGCSWRWTPKLPITGKCLECDAARKYETCDCGDALVGSAASRQTRQSGRRNLKFGYVELNTGFVVEGSVELAGVSLADAEAHAADITQTIIDVAGGVRPADVTTCASATTTTPTCTVENQLCTTGAGTTAEKKYCCIFDEAGSGTWTAGACVPDRRHHGHPQPSSRRRLQYQNQGADEVLVEYQIQVPEALRRHRGRLGRRAVHGAGQVPRRRDRLQGLVLLHRAAVLPPGACPARSGPTSAARTGGGPRAAATCSTWPGATRSTPRRRQERPRPSAAADPNTVGDGICDAANNVAPCYDGGDCCEATCPSSQRGLRRRAPPGRARVRRRLREHPRHGGPQRDRGRRRGRDHEEGLRSAIAAPPTASTDRGPYPPPLPPFPPPRPIGTPHPH